MHPKHVFFYVLLIVYLFFTSFTNILLFFYTQRALRAVSATTLDTISR